MNDKISVIGMGKLGLPMAYLYASCGYNVIGVDSNEQLIWVLRAGKIPIYETGLEDLRGHITGNLEFSQDIKYAVNNSEVSFIIVPTPSQSNGKFSNKYVVKVLREIGKALQKKNDFHVIVVVSTVMVGSCEGVFKPLLEKITKKKCGVEFGLVYNPEFIALGSVLKDLSNPDAILIGESDTYSGSKVETIVKSVCNSDPSVHRMNYYNAELSKIGLNVFLTTKITLANTYAELCEKIPNGDVDMVTKFIGSDSRIGNKFLKGGSGYGGPCLGRDNRAFAKVAQKYHANYKLQKATDSSNVYHKDRIWWIIKEWFKVGKGYDVSDKVFGILGITYKPDTSVTEESATLAVISDLLAYGAKIKIYDPAQSKMVHSPFDDKVQYVKDAQTCIDGSDAVIIMTPWNEFKSLSVDNFKQRTYVLDCWRILDRSKLGNNVIYRGIGLNVNQ